MNTNKWLNIKLPVFNIYLLFFSIILNPIINIERYSLWQIIPAVLIIINFKYLVKSFNLYRNFLPFLIYVIISGLINLFLQKGFSNDVFLKLLLFFVSYSSFLLLISSAKYFENHQEKLITIFNQIITIIIIYGFYQFAGRIIGLPFTMDEALRGRYYFGIKQLSSFFEEPAFLAQFLYISLFIHLFILNAKYTKIIIAIFALLILSISVSGYIGSLIILAIWFVKKLNNSINSKRLLFKTVSLAIVVIIVVFYFSKSDIFDFIAFRVKNTFIFNDQILEIARNPKDYDIDGSGIRRIFGEIVYLIDILKTKYAFTGYGIDYSNIIPERIMGLNVITEFILRWGLVGFSLFILPLLSLIRKYNSFTKGIYLILFVFFFIDGAIAKLVFWLLVGLLIIFLKSFHIINNKK